MAHPNFRCLSPCSSSAIHGGIHFAEVVQARLTLSELSEAQRKAIWEQVYQIWAVPSLKIGSTAPQYGAAVDVTLVNSTGQTVNMGSGDR